MNWGTDLGLEPDTGMNRQLATGDRCFWAGEGGKLPPFAGSGGR